MSDPTDLAASDSASPRAALAELTRQAHGLAELDRLSGVPVTPVPTLAREAPQARARVELPQAAPSAEDPELAARRAHNEVRLEELPNRMNGCTRCKLSEGRTNLVFGQGDAAAELIFVGEGPGYHEDMQGLAFVGRAGELLTKMIQAMGLRREEVFIANCVKCRPPGNRNPQPDEMATCLPFLREQLEIIKPKVICGLGKTAGIGLGLIEPRESLGRNRGRFFEWNGIPTILTYHPAYLLRTPRDKAKTWADLQKTFPLIQRRRA